MSLLITEPPFKVLVVGMLLIFFHGSGSIDASEKIFLSFSVMAHFET